MYRWRHDRVLRQLAESIDEEQRKKFRVSTKPVSIHCVKEGQSTKPVSSQRTGMLSTSQSWEMRVDLEKKLHFPEVVHTNLRPDVVVWSKHSKKIIAIELTVPWEERCEEAYERKTEKYAELMD